MNKDKIQKVARQAKTASLQIARLKSREKNAILLEMSKSIYANRKKILYANRIDIKNAIFKGMKKSFIDRLSLDRERILFMADSLRQIARLKDHVGTIESKRILKNGLKIIERRCGFGVIAVIYESRPNVTSDACGLCLKSSSAAILKGGKEAMKTNNALIAAIKQACPIKHAFQLINFSDRLSINRLLKLDEFIDLVIPRGGIGLIKFVKENSRIPVIETGSGNCHIYIDKTADIKNAVKIIINAKTQMPSVCNSVEKLVVHKAIAAKFLPQILQELKKFEVEILGCEKTAKIIQCKRARESDWKAEYLGLKIAIKTVENLQEAIVHINKYSTRHSEAIIGRDKKSIKEFFYSIDSAVVYSNASTRFTDGFEFGLGAEIGISTQKLHARGPMALKALTTTKYIVEGKGHIRDDLNG